MQEERRRREERERKKAEVRARLEAANKSKKGKSVQGRSTIIISHHRCALQIVINSKTYDIVKQAIRGVNINNCEHPCSGQPCKNGGKCVPIREYYQCSCPLGYENTNCEDRKFSLCRNLF